MNKKIAILSLFILGIVFLSGCSQNKTIFDELSDQASIKAEKIEVINFHATQRCVACNTLGRYSQETINEFFQPELRSGIINFQSINVDLPENKEIVRKYQARGSSLYINAIYNGQDQIEEDIKVWRFLGDEQQFKNYLKDKINKLLNK